MSGRLIFCWKTDRCFNATCVTAIVYFAPRPKKKEGVNLLSGEAAEWRPQEELAAEEGPPEWISFFKPNVTITMVDDFTAYPADKVPEHVSGACILL